MIQKNKKKTEGKKSKKPEVGILRRSTKSPTLITREKRTKIINISYKRGDITINIKMVMGKYYEQI